ncbi:hypothetical protein C8Q80DRAFT_234530 [Daedaleopsis nitida]|nr:hypothetical protein C8Q80DRAFT_234530 [Daedaleopsis nitida]
MSMIPWPISTAWQERTRADRKSGAFKVQLASRHCPCQDRRARHAQPSLAKASATAAAGRCDRSWAYAASKRNSYPARRMSTASSSSSETAHQSHREFGTDISLSPMTYSDRALPSRRQHVPYGGQSSAAGNFALALSPYSGMDAALPSGKPKTSRFEGCVATREGSPERPCSPDPPSRTGFNGTQVPAGRVPEPTRPRAGYSESDLCSGPRTEY